MSTVESIARPRRNGERRRAPTASISKESPAIFFNDTATTEIYTLSLHDALPIYQVQEDHHVQRAELQPQELVEGRAALDRKSTRLNSSHQIISYAVFCLKKKKLQ